MSITSPDDRVSEYNPVVATTEFAADFPVFDNDDIKVFVDGVERDDFAVTATYVEGISTDAKAVFAIGIVGKVQVVGAREPHRTNRFGSGPMPPRDLNLALDTLEAEVQELHRDAGRAVKVAVGSNPVNITAGTGGQIPVFDSSGNLIPGSPNGAGNMMREAYDPRSKGRDLYPFDTKAEVATRNLAAYTEVIVNRWSSGSLYAPAPYRKVGSEPSHAGKVQSADGAWWEIAAPVLTSAMLGLLGDWNTDTRTGTNETAAIDAAFAVAVAVERELRILDGVYYHIGELNYPAGLRVCGTHRRRSQFYLEINNTQAGGRIEAQNVHIEDIGHLVYLTAGLGADDGEYGSGWTLGRYYTNGTPIQTENVTAFRIGCYVAPSSPFSPAHGFSGLGRITGVYADDIEVEGFAGSAIHFHWGAHAAGIGQPITASYHPNNLRFRNLKAENCGRPFTFSSCFNVSLVGIRGDCDRFGDIIPGDETDFYAVADEKPFVGSSIRISDFDVSGLVDVSSLGGLRVTSLGTSRVDTDAPTGLGTRRLLTYKKVVVENGKLTGADSVTRAIDLTATVGDVTIRNVDVTEVARSGTGLRLADTRGNIVIDNVSVAAALGIDWLRAWGVRCVNMDLTMKNRTGLAGDLIGVSVDGTEFSTTLSANKIAGATSILLTAALGATLNPGDVLIVDGNHVKVSGTRQIRSTETSIPIEAMAWTALSGTTVYCDQRSVPKVRSSRCELYDFGASISDCRGINFSDSEFIDIAKQGITGVAKSGFIGRNRFIRGGQHRLTDGAYASRNIILSAGCDNITVRDNEFGIDADYIDICLQTSSDTGNIRVKDNAFGNAITAHLSLATQSNARLDASQFNEYSGNYRTDGGQLTGPSTWYEILQNAMVRYHGTAAPTRGYHRAGSEWVHTAPAVGSPIGGMCTVSGTPGSWVNKANL